MNLPHHVAFIMDGNGRWAKEKGLPRSKGHLAGINHIKKVKDIYISKEALFALILTVLIVGIFSSHVFHIK